MPLTSEFERFFRRSENIERYSKGNTYDLAFSGPVGDRAVQISMKAPRRTSTEMLIDSNSISTGIPIGFLLDLLHLRKWRRLDSSVKNLSFLLISCLIGRMLWIKFGDKSIEEFELFLDVFLAHLDLFLQILFLIKAFFFSII